jgi:predicted  nucleic acid-binding Zn-ribbon protein
MNANLRGNVLVKGLPIEEFIRKVAKTETNSNAVDNTVVKQDVTEVTRIVTEKMRPLEAFQDEKKILSETLTSLGTRVQTLEAMDMSKLGGGCETKCEKQLEKMQKQLEKMEKNMEKKIVDMEKKIVDMEKKILDVEKKIVDMKPRRGVDQATLDNAIVSAQKTIESRIKVVSDSLAQLRSELEEE